jgi:hypothetical protein
MRQLGLFPSYPRRRVPSHKYIQLGSRLRGSDAIQGVTQPGSDSIQSGLSLDRYASELRTSVAASIVFLMSSSECAAETKLASNWLHGR